MYDLVPFFVHFLLMDIACRGVDRFLMKIQNKRISPNTRQGSSPTRNLEKGSNPFVGLLATPEPVDGRAHAWT